MDAHEVVDFENDETVRRSQELAAREVSGRSFRPRFQNGKVLRSDKTRMAEEDVEKLLNSLGNGDISDFEFEDSDSGEEVEYNDCEFNDSSDYSSDDLQDETEIPEPQVTKGPKKKVQKAQPSKGKNQPPKGQASGKNGQVVINPIGWNNKLLFRPPASDWKGQLKVSDYEELPTPFSLLTKYYDNEFYEECAKYTNIYMMQHSGNNHKPTTANEMRQLFALHVIMGTMKFPQRCMYWDYPTRSPAVADVMTRKRFFHLRTNLHFVDNLKRPNGNTDKFWKVRPMIDKFIKRCHELEIESNICVDEQMIPYKGKFNVKQYVKNKPCPWGIKAFVLCGESGIVYDLILYQGATTEFDQEMYRKFGLGTTTVLELTSRVPMHQNYKLYFDNYFSTLQLLQELREKGILAAGTIRRNRLKGCPLPLDKLLKKKERGESVEITNDKQDVVVVCWKDNNPVLLASNFVGIGEQDIVERWNKKEKEYIEVIRPEIVQKYNSSMGGVDHCDQMMAAYRIFIRSNKWPLRVVFHFYDLAIVNSWFEYRQIATDLKVPTKKIMSLIHFRMSVASCLLKSGIMLTTVKRGRPSNDKSPKIKKRRNDTRPENDIRYDTVGHFPTVLEHTEGQRCKFEGCNKKTIIFCLKCKLSLCLVKGRNCFLDFHVKL